MPRLLIKRASVVLPDRVRPGHSVAVEDGKVVSVAPDDAIGGTFDETVDADGCCLAPGFIDLHIHGTHGFSVDDGPEALAGLCALLPRYGVTGFLPTLTARPHDEHVDLLRSLSTAKTDGAAVLGFHLEGPYVALSGALPRGAVHPVRRRDVQALIEAARPCPAVFSISPEVDGILDVIPVMAANDTPVFVTHTAATVSQTVAAIDAGARHATHFYDVFPCPAETDRGVRPAGAVEAILADGRVTVDFILDGEHVDPVAVKLALLCKGPEGVCLATDANVGAGLPPGRHRFGEHEVAFAFPGAPARFVDNPACPNGLAGSGLTMDRAVRNARDMLDVTLPQAVRMASANPAAVLGLTEHKGAVREGCDADLVLLDDDLHVVKTWIGGTCCYSRKED